MLSLEISFAANYLGLMKRSSHGRSLGNDSECVLEYQSRAIGKPGAIRKSPQSVGDDSHIMGANRKPRYDNN
jgi:hypothetical protein